MAERVQVRAISNQVSNPGAPIELVGRLAALPALPLLLVGRWR